MKAYYDRYAYRNATVEGLLQTVEDQFGTEIRQRMDDNLNKPNYELKPEFRLTEAEKANFNRTTMTQLYDGILGQHRIFRNNRWFASCPRRCMASRSRSC